MKKIMRRITNGKNAAARCGLLTVLGAATILLLGISPAAAQWYSVTACGDCHGNPPRDGVRSTSALTSTVAGNHTKHASTTAVNYGFSCTICHRDNGAAPAGLYHENRNIDMLAVFATYSGSYSKGTVVGSLKSFPQVTNPVMGTCNTNNCHSTGQSNTGGATVVYSTPTWSGAALTCGSCHSNMNVSTTAPGNHPKHVLSAQIVCASCHGGYTANSVSTLIHVNTTVNTTFTGTAAGTFYTGGTPSGTYTLKTGYGACFTSYCHSSGQTLTTNLIANVTPTWGIKLNADCTGCHGGNATSTITMNSRAHFQHISSVSRVGRNIACGECHNATVATTSDRSITTQANHVNRWLNIRFDNLVNRNTDTPLYNGATTSLATGATKTPGAGGFTCSNVYCHSIGNLSGTNPATNTLVSAGGVSFRTIAWDGAAIVCTGCHGDGSTKSHPTYTSGSAGTTTANTHVKHVEAAGKSCDICHLSTTADSAIPPTTLATGTQHMNRVETVSFKTVSAGTASWAAGTKTCSSLSCHGAAAWGGPPLDCNGCHGAAQDNNDGAPTRRGMSSETTSLAWGHKKTALGVWTSNDCGVCHMEGSPSTGATTTWHKNNLLDFRSPDTGTLILGVAFTAASGTNNPGSYSSTVSAISAATFSRNTGTSGLEAFAQAVMINLCLSCHDANGASSTLSRVATAVSGTQPFSSPSGTALNISSHFTTTNASYHPVRGQGNNSYADSDTMVAPWNQSLKTAGSLTGWGNRITCWDCHDSSAASRTIGGTIPAVTSHGNATTLRATYTAPSGVPTPLCVICHKQATYWGTLATDTAHMVNTGSAFFTAISDANWTAEHANDAGRFFGCTVCHGTTSSAGVAAGRAASITDTVYNGMNAHGFNTLFDGTATTYSTITPATAGARPWAFLRASNNQIWRPRMPGATTNGACDSGLMCGRTDGPFTYTPGGIF